MRLAILILVIWAALVLIGSKPGDSIPSPELVNLYHATGPTGIVVTVGLIVITALFGWWWVKCYQKDESGVGTTMVFLPVAYFGILAFWRVFLVVGPLLDSLFRSL